MNKIIKKVCILFTALLSLSIGSNYVTRVNAEEVTESYTFSTAPTDAQISAQEVVYNIGEVTMTWTKGESSNKIAAYSPIRIYQKHNVEFTVSSKVSSLDSISITASSTNYATAAKTTWTGGTASASGSVVSVSCTANTVTFVASAQTRWSSISVTYTLNDNVQALEQPETFTYNSENRSLEWSTVENADYYNVNVLDENEEIVKSYEGITSTSVNLNYSDYENNATYTATIEACSNDQDSYSNSKVLSCEGFTFVYTSNEVLASSDTLVQLDLGYDYAAGETVNVDATMSYSGSTTNMTGGNDAELLGLDKSLFTVVGAKNEGNNNNVGLNSNKTIRLYKGGNTITISCLNTINSIEFTYDDGTYSTDDITVTVDGSVVSYNEENSNQYVINSTEFVISNIDSKTAFYFTELAINYSVESVVYSNFRNVNLRYSATIPTDSFANVDSFGINITVDSKSKDYAISKYNVTDDGYNFALVIKNITDYDAVITATAYVVVNEERINFKSKSYSVKEMVNYYINNVDLSYEQLQVLNAFNEANA